MLKDLFVIKLYVRVLKNGFEITDLSHENRTETVSCSEAFTTHRLLVGEFSKAEACLRAGLVKIVGKGMIKRSPEVVIHPTIMTEHGLSEVEQRVFRELACGAGAHKVVLWVGKTLTLEEAENQLDN